MKKFRRSVMSSVKGSKKVNVVPTKRNVDYDYIYSFNNLNLVEKTFIMFEDNRTLNKPHIRQIQNSIITNPNDAKFIAPIRIDINTMGVIDGQHRLSAFKKAWQAGSKENIRVIFENIPKDILIDIIATINSTTKNWGIPDYQHRLFAEDNIHMLNIKKFGMDHKLCQKKDKSGKVVDFFPRYAYAILFGKNMTKEVKNGTINISKSDLKFGEQIHSELEEMVTALQYNINSWFESFAHAWFNIRKYDKEYSNIFDELGLEKVCQNIKYFFKGHQVVTRKSIWEQRFRTMLCEIKRSELL